MRGEIRVHGSQRSQEGHREPVTFVANSVTAVEPSVIKGKLHEAFLRLGGELAGKTYLHWMKSSETGLLDHHDVREWVDSLGKESVDVPTEDDDRIRIIQIVLRLPNIIAKLCDSYLGRFIRAIIATDSRQDMVSILCNLAEQKKVVECRKFATSCGCDSCTLFINGTSKKCCASVQLQTHVNNRQYTNFTPSYLFQCSTLSKRVPLHSPILTKTESANDVRLLVNCAADLIERAWCELVQSHKPPGSMIVLGTLPTFSVHGATDHQQAVSYCDGDGGYIIAEYVPGLLDYCETNYIPQFKVALSGNQLTQIPFREAFHDAVELGHNYYFDTCWPGETRDEHLEVKVGHKALCLQRNRMGNSSHTNIVVVDVLRSGGPPRLLVEISTTIEGIQDANGLCAVREGYSFAATIKSPVTPRVYQQAEIDAKHLGSGMWKAGQEFFSLVESMKPWDIKQDLRSINTCMEKEKQLEDCNLKLKIRNKRAHLNEAHLFVARSTIKAAGLGLFIRPPTGDNGEIRIPAITILCVYGRPAPEGIVDSDSDYYLCREFGGRLWHYDAKKVDGENIGRYINQGALMDGLTTFCTHSSLGTIPDTKVVVDRGCNVAFHHHNNRACVRTTREIVVSAGSESLELMIDYGITQYWFPYLLKRAVSPSMLTSLHLAVLWPLFSPESRLPRKARARLIGDVLISDDVVEHVKHLPCPFEVPRTRSLRAGSTH